MQSAQVRNYDSDRDKFVPYCAGWNIRLALKYVREKDNPEPELRT